MIGRHTMPDDRAPISPKGWKITRYTYDDKPPVNLQSGRSLEWCQQYKSNWGVHALGTAELVISPVDGWESLNSDPFMAVAWAIKSDLVSLEVGAQIIQAMMERRVPDLPAEALLGLARHYTDAASKELGGDEQLAELSEQLRENQTRLAVGVDGEPDLPF